MEQKILAIDFGSHAVKVAWRDDLGQVHPLTFDARPSLPTVFFLPESTSEILVGEPACEAAQDEPVRAVTDLVRCIVDHRPVRTTPDRPIQAEQLLEAIFLRIMDAARVQCADVAATGLVRMCWPASGSMRLRRLLEQAALAASFHEIRWIAQEQALVRHAMRSGEIPAGEPVRVVVVDCGSAGTRWSAVDMPEGTACATHGREMLPVGGQHLDHALFDWFQRNAPTDCAVRPERRLLDQLRDWKERALRADVPPLRIRGRAIALNRQVLIEQQRLLAAPVVEELGRYLAAQRHDKRPLAVLVAGGAHSPLLLQSIRGLATLSACVDHPTNAYLQGALGGEPAPEPPTRAAPPTPARTRSWGAPSGQPSLLDAFTDSRPEDNAPERST